MHTDQAGRQADHTIVLSLEVIWKGKEFIDFLREHKDLFSEMNQVGHTRRIYQGYGILQGRRWGLRKIN